MLPKLIGFPALMLVLFVLTSSQAADAKRPQFRVSKETAEQIIKVSALAEQGDRQMINLIGSVANWLERFRQDNGHFPEAGVEQDFFIKTLQERIPYNPYRKEGLATWLAPERCPIEFRIDASISPNMVSLWEDELPKSWSTGAPGTIKVFLDGYNSVLVWGVNSEGRPVRIKATGKIKLDLRQYNDPEPIEESAD